MERPRASDDLQVLAIRSDRPPPDPVPGRPSAATPYSRAKEKPVGAARTISGPPARSGNPDAVKRPLLSTGDRLRDGLAATPTVRSRSPVNGRPSRRPPALSAIATAFTHWPATAEAARCGSLIARAPARADMTLDERSTICRQCRLRISPLECHRSGPRLIAEPADLGGFGPSAAPREKTADRRPARETSTNPGRWTPGADPVPTTGRPLRSGAGTAGRPPAGPSPSPPPKSGRTGMAIR